MQRRMRDDHSTCTCGHTRRGHYGGSGRLRDAGTCKTADCRCRNYSSPSMVDAARVPEQEIRT